MHSCELAQELGIPRVLLPSHPGILSALGVAIADIVKDYSRTVMLRGNDVNINRLEEEFHGMENQAREEMRLEGLPVDRMQAQRFVDVRYVGQSFELTIEYPSSRRALQSSISNSFYKAHLQRFGYADRTEAVEIVNLRLKLRLEMEKPSIASGVKQGADPSGAKLDDSPVVFPSGQISTPTYDRDKLRYGNRIQGPALLIQLDTTILVPPGWAGTVDQHSNLVLEPE